MDGHSELTEDAVRKIMEGHGNDPGRLISVLLDIQAASGRNYVDRKWAGLVSVVMGVPLSLVFDTLTFYAVFAAKPGGRYVIEICRSAPCHFCGAEKTAGWFEAAAGIRVGETTWDGKITLARTDCVGACDTGPAVKIGDDVFGVPDEEKARELVRLCREGTPEKVLQCEG